MLLSASQWGVSANGTAEGAPEEEAPEDEEEEEEVDIQEMCYISGHLLSGTHLIDIHPITGELETETLLRCYDN